MENLNQGSALELVRIALQAGAIKLLGPNNINQAQPCAEADAKYILALISGLQKQAA